MKPDIDAIRERAERATPGPWKVVEKGNTVKSVAVTTFAVAWTPQEMICPNMSPKTGNADFIANARTDIPALLAYIDQQDKRIAELKQERDAAVIDMKLLANEYGFCDMCKYFNSQQACEEPHPGLLCAEHKKWEWRGVKK